MWFNIVLFCINIIVLAAGFFIINSRVEKKVTNQEVLSKIKKEINSIIVELNNTTLNNVTLIEQKLKELDSKIIMADKKKAGLKMDLKGKKDEIKDLFENIEKITYTPKKIARNTEIAAENLSNNSADPVDEELKGMNDAEKARYLIRKGWKLADVQKKTGLSSGEMELLLNTENINITY